VKWRAQPGGKLVPVIRYRLVVLGAFLLGVWGCSRPLYVNSHPPGADVFVNDEKVGTTPCTKRYGRSEMLDYQVRVEKEGYYAYSTTAHPRVSAGSIVASIMLTCGISMLFLPPRYYPEMDIALVPLGQIDDSAKRAKTLHDSGVITDEEYNKLAGPDERARQLRALKDKGILTQEEFDRLTNPQTNK
jgi:hypothetical protein